jgi:hypothetical protein
MKQVAKILFKNLVVNAKKIEPSNTEATSALISKIDKLLEVADNKMLHYVINETLSYTPQSSKLFNHHFSSANLTFA